MPTMKRSSRGPRRWLDRKKQFEAVCPLLLEAGEVLAVPTVEDLTPAMLVYAPKSGAVLDPQAVAAGRGKQLQALEEQKAIILVPHDFPLAGAKRIRSKWLDDYSSSGTEVKSRLVATEVAYGSRDDCFAGTGETGFLKRVLRYDAETGSFTWCSGKRYVQDAATTLHSRDGPPSARQLTLLARRALVRLCETETRSLVGTTRPPSGAHWVQ